MPSNIYTTDDICIKLTGNGEEYLKSQNANANINIGHFIVTFSPYSGGEN